MRLMHLGKTVYVVNETTTPGITAGDLLILGSGSGKTSGLLTIGEQARRQGAKTLLFTADETSPLAVLADHLVLIPAPLIEDGEEEEGNHGRTSVQPLGTLFEQSLLILCDSLVSRLMQRNGVSAAQMFERHANLQ
jgi:6-phospho-3-hexuloisomerase